MYIRKGTKGAKSFKSLRAEYEYYRKRVIERLAYEQAFKEARGAGSVEGRIKTLFKPQTYDELFVKGITRKKKNVTVRYFGEEAVRVKIESFKRRASKTRQADTFINNFTDAMLKKGYTLFDAEKVDRALRSISVNRLTYLINEPPPKGIPSIEFIYEYGHRENIVEAVKNSIKASKSQDQEQELKHMTKIAKVLAKQQKEKEELIYGDRVL